MKRFAMVGKLNGLVVLALLVSIGGNSGKSANAKGNDNGATGGGRERDRNNSGLEAEAPPTMINPFDNYIVEGVSPGTPPRSWLQSGRYDEKYQRRNNQLALDAWMAANTVEKGMDFSNLFSTLQAMSNGQPLNGNSASSGPEVMPSSAQISQANVVLDNIVEACQKYVIQREMGLAAQSQDASGNFVSVGESGMSTAMIEAYEAKIHEMCNALRSGHRWIIPSGAPVTSDGRPRSDSGLADPNQLPEKDLLLTTLDNCVEVSAHSMSDSCIAAYKDYKENASIRPDLNECIDNSRIQCYQHMIQSGHQTVPYVTEDMVGKCDFRDQTVMIKKSCRSYCHGRNVCEIKSTDYDAEKGIIGGGFEDKEISDIYLLKNKAIRPCNKNSTFGVKDRNHIWSAYNCDGEFAVKYKEPRCGYRPHCRAGPLNGFVPITGTQKVVVNCDGYQSLDGLDYYCPVAAMKSSAVTGIVDRNHDDYMGLETSDNNAVALTAEVDPDKIVKRIVGIELLEQIGDAECRKGDSRNPLDTYGPGVDVSSGLISVMVQKNCSGKFEVEVEWEQQRCSYAGEVVNNPNLCCQGVVGEKILNKDQTETGKYMCNAPNPALLEVTNPIPEAVQLESFVGSMDICQNRDTFQGKKNDFDNQTLRPLFDEIARYELMVTMLGQDSEILRMSDPNTHPDLETLRPHLAMYDLLEHLHDGFIFLRTKLLERERIKAAALEYQASDLALTEAYEDKRMKGELAKDEVLTKTAGNVMGEKFFKEEANYDTSKNIFAGKDLVGDFAAYATKVILDIDLADNSAKEEIFKEYGLRMAQASQLGFNFVWLCAHSDSCSVRGWMINVGGEAGGIVDFYHDPVYPFQDIDVNVLNPIIPVLNEIKSISDIDRNQNGLKDDVAIYPVKKHLISKNSLVQFEQVMAGNSLYKEFHSYMDGTTRVLDQSALAGDTMLGLFRKFSVDLPLMKESHLFADQELRDYYDSGRTDSSGATEGGSPGKAFVEVERLGIYYCDKQDEFPNFRVRVPYGKALLLYRLAKVADVLSKYSQNVREFNQRLLTKCEIGTNPEGGSQGDTSTKVSENFVTRPETPTVSGDLFDPLDPSTSGAGGSTGGSSNPNVVISRNSGGGISSFSGVYAGAPGSVTGGDYSGGGNTTVGKGNLAPGKGTSAIENMQRLHQEAVNRALASGDTKLAKHLDSLKALVNEVDPKMSARSRATMGGAATLGGAGLGSGLGSVGAAPLSSRSMSPSSVTLRGDSSYTTPKGNSTSSANYGQYGSGVKGRNYSGEYGKAKGQGNGATGTKGTHKEISGKDAKEILRNLDSKEYDRNILDNLFDIITKRYIRSAFPQLLKKVEN